VAKSQRLLAALWDLAYDQAKQSGATFYEQLRLQAADALKRVLPGQISSLSGLGESFQTADGRGPDYSPTDLQDATQELVETYEDQARSLVTSDPETIYLAGRAGPLRGVTRFGTNFSCYNQ